MLPLLDQRRRGAPRAVDRRHHLRGAARLVPARARPGRPAAGGVDQRGAGAPAGPAAGQPAGLSVPGSDRGPRRGHAGAPGARSRRALQGIPRPGRTGRRL